MQQHVAYYSDGGSVHHDGQIEATSQDCNWNTNEGSDVHGSHCRVAAQPECYHARATGVQ